MKYVFHERLKDLREDFGLTQKDLSHKTGISKSSLSRYELQEQEPTLSVILTLANFFSVTMDYLVGLED